MIQEIILKSIKLHEFCGATGEMDLKFNRSLTEFIGDNGKGKSLIINSFAWLLTGKDAFGETRSPFTNNGIKNAYTFVEAVCTIDGEDVELKRIAERSSAGKTTQTLWKDHENIKTTDWKEMFDPDICLTLINPKYLSSKSSKDMKNIIMKILNFRDIDFSSLVMDVFNELTGANFDEFTEILEMFGELGDVDSVSAHIDDNLKALKKQMDERKDNIKAFEETPKESPAPFKFKVGNKYYFNETDAYNAVEDALLKDVSSNLDKVREFATIMSQYALLNKNYTDYLEKEKAYKEDLVVLSDYKEEEAVLKRQKEYMERINEKIIENLNLESLTNNNISFAFKDLFDKNSFIIAYNGNSIEDLSYAEQVRVGICLADYLLKYLGFNYPIFVDNAECITSLPTVDNSRQLISMQVAYGYELCVYGEKEITEVKTLKTMPRVDKSKLIKSRIIGSCFDISE